MSKRMLLPAAALALFGLAPGSGVCAGGPPAITAQAAVVIAADSGQVLCVRNPNQRMFPASLTKVMTGALTVESGNLDRVVSITQNAANVPETGIDLQANEHLPLRDVLQAALIWSANDAAYALAEAVGGNAEGFAVMMNRRARDWGATHTHFANPHGLHNPNHYSTAMDLALIAAHAMRLPEFREIVRMRSVRMARPIRSAAPVTGKDGKAIAAPKAGPRSENRLLTNRNRLLLRWPLCDGVKSGYTRAAGRCLIASATRDGWQAIVVTLKANDPSIDCRALLDWAFRTYRLREVYARGTEVGRVAVADGATGHVRVATGAPARVLLAAGAAAPEMKIEAGTAQAPIARGQEVGRLLLLTGGKVRARVPLVACEGVALNLWGQIKRRSLPDFVGQGLLGLASGVLLLGTAAKATRTRRSCIAPRQRAVDRGGPSDSGRGGRARAGNQGRSRQQRDSG
jgi:serine-type D-Ala-D-Ala carboxypeptidase (penicillin-binding protein 5/6)